MDIKSKKVDIKTKKSDKQKIVLCNSYNEGFNHTNIRFKTYRYIPHYTILKNGGVYKHLDDNSDSTILDKESIIVSLENWGELLEENGEKRHLYSIYNGEAIECEWRGFKSFDNYTEQQIEQTIELTSFLLNKHDIWKQCMFSNILLKNNNTQYGVYYRANFDKNFLDLSPAFPFEEFKKTVEHE
jgi:hypothetical protein